MLESNTGRKNDDLEIYYFRNTRNFGDALNEIFWAELIGHSLNQLKASRIRIIGIGTLLNKSLPVDEKVNHIVGSGFGYGDPPSRSQIPVVHFVRGPITAKILGLPESNAITDPAYVANKILNLPHITSKKGIAFIPHWETHNFFRWDWICKLIGIRYISPLNSFQKVVHEIASSELLISESLHGAILADALRTPWIPTTTSTHIDERKWHDFGHTIQVNIDFKRITNPGSRKNLIKNPLRVFRHCKSLREISSSRPLLSNENISNEVKERLMLALIRFKNTIRELHS